MVPLLTSRTARSALLLAGAVLLSGAARAQSADASTTSSNAWPAYDWLQPAESQKRAVASGETFTATQTQQLGDPFAVISSGSIWQEQHGALYARQIGDGVTLSSATSSVALSDDPNDLSRTEQVGLQFQPGSNFILRANVHDAENDAALAPTTTTGAGLAVESHLPTNSTLSLGLNSDHTEADLPTFDSTVTNAYDASLQQPLGKLPLTAVIKGHYEGASSDGGEPTNLPSLEQSLVWKPAQDTTLQAGLRQQQYQEYPGVDHELNEALFADWSQKVVDNISWHSYAELLNSRGLLDQAPAAAITSGANGTAQANVPAANTSLTSSLPVSIDDQTLTFSTGPSIELQKDVSANLEFSDRWDKNPAPGTVGEEQRVSLSLKGTF